MRMHHNSSDPNLAYVEGIVLRGVVLPGGHALLQHNIGQVESPAFLEKACEGYAGCTTTVIWTVVANSIG